MKKSRPEQIIEKLRQADVELGKGLSVPEVCRAIEVSQTGAAIIFGADTIFDRDRDRRRRFVRIRPRGCLDGRRCLAYGPGERQNPRLRDWKRLAG